jgi:hypothetical protein
MALLREHGMELDPSGGLRMADRDAPVAPAADAPAPDAPVVEQAQAAPPEPRVIWRGTMPPPPPPSPPTRTLRFKLGWGSILGWTQVPDHAIEPTGSCVDPALTAKYEKDPKIEKMPWRPAKLDRAFGQVRLPEVLRDSVIKSDEVLVRFVADTNSTVIPESVSVLDSPSGTLSVQVCMAVVSGTFEPAKDRAGSVVPSWVQTAVRVNRF